MQRFTISIEDDLAAQFTEWIEKHRYSNRSEAFRDLLRERVAEEALQGAADSHCAASVTYVYDHHERELSHRLNQHQHEHHDLTVSTLHVHLDALRCLEVAVLRGPMTAVNAEAKTLIAERGVRHGKVHVIPLEAGTTHSTWHKH